MMAGIHTAFLKFSVVVGSSWAKGKKPREYLLVAGLLSLSDQLLGMVRVFDVFVSVVGPCMAGNEFFAVVDADPVGVSFESQGRSGVFGGNGVMIGVDIHPELTGSAHLGNRTGIVGVRWKGQ